MFKMDFINRIISHIYFFCRKISVRNKKTIDKKIAKHASAKCKICDEPNYHLLDVHRIVPGANSGKYIFSNVLIICVSCHRKVHSGQIRILGWVDSTAGPMLHYIDENGIEQFK